VPLEAVVDGGWEADPSAVFARRLVHGAALPEGVSLRGDERVVVLPGGMLSAAKADIPDA
jgi:hypothetical protein